MAKTIGAEKARERLPELLNKAARGQTTIITKHGKAYAAVGPVQSTRVKGHSFVALAGSGRGMWGDIRKYIAAERDWE